MTGKKKAKITLFLLMTMLLVLGTTASAGFRRMSNGRYRYYVTANTYLKGRQHGKITVPAIKNLSYDGKKYTYAFDRSGYMLTGWQIFFLRLSL